MMSEVNAAARCRDQMSDVNADVNALPRSRGWHKLASSWATIKGHANGLLGRTGNLSPQF